MRRFSALAVAVAVLWWPAHAAAQDEPAPDSPGRPSLVLIPPGCQVPPLPDVVFVGTIDAIAAVVPAGGKATAELQTARLRIDQVRAGEIAPFSFNGMIDVRYGVDAKYLDEGEQYLIGASVDPTARVLVSKVREPEPLFGGDEIVGAAETDIECPVLTDPNRTLHVDGTGIESGVLTPLSDSTPRLLRSIALPIAVAFAVVFGLTALRWAITGVGYGVGSAYRTAREPREVRSARRSRGHDIG